MNPADGLRMHAYAQIRRINIKHKRTEKEEFHGSFYGVLCKPLPSPDPGNTSSCALHLATLWGQARMSQDDINGSAGFDVMQATDNTDPFFAGIN